MSLIARKHPGIQHVTLHDYHSNEVVAFWYGNNQINTDGKHFPLVQRYGQETLINFCKFVAENGDKNWFVIGLPGGD